MQSSMHLIESAQSFQSIPNALPKPISARIYNIMNVDAFSQDLDWIEWSTNNIQNANLYSSIFLPVFNQVLDIHAPMTEIKPLKEKRNKMSNPVLPMIF